MQDNPNNSFDPALINRGWADLEKRLDENLPQKPKRRFLWFWLPLLLGAVVLGGTAWMAVGLANSVKEPAARQNISTPEQPIAQTETSASLPLTPVPTVESASVEQQQATASVSTQQPTPSTSMLTTQEISILPTKNRPATNRSTAPPVKFAEAVANDPPILAEAEIVENTISASSPNTAEEISSENTINAVSVANTSVVNQLDKLDIPLLTGEELIPTDFPSINTAKVRSKWNAYAEGQVIMALGNQAGTLGIGVGVERQLAGKWHLGLGFTYERSQQDLSTRVFKEDVSDEFESVPQGAYNLSFDVNSVYRNISYERIKSELQVAYQLSPRWRLSTGLALNYYKQAVLGSINSGVFTNIGGEPDDILSETRIDLYEDSLSVFSYDLENNVARESYQLSPNRWQLAQTIGVQYQFAPRWSANLNYRHDLTNWDRSDDIAGSSSFAQFGLRYYFGK